MNDKRKSAIFEEKRRNFRNQLVQQKTVKQDEQKEQNNSLKTISYFEYPTSLEKD